MDKDKTLMLKLKRNYRKQIILFQFEKASQIHSVDIGNEGSAFVEVLVGKSTSSLDYQVKWILIIL